MLTLSQVGFFRELRHGSANGPSIHDCCSNSAQPNEQEIIQYLSAAATLVATGSVVGDVLDSTKKAVAPLEIATDGTWVWPRDLAYYMTNYHVVLPSESVEYMRKWFWDPPSLRHEDLVRIGEDLAVSSDRSNSGRWNHGFLKH